MSAPEIHACGCAVCQGEDTGAERVLHHQINLLMSRLDEQQRRWYAAVEARRQGRGGIKLLSQITGLDAKTIARGRRELEAELGSRPRERVRLPGGGRHSVEKKVPKSK